MIPHLLRYQGLAVDDYGFVLDALDMGHPKLSLNYGFITPLLRIICRNQVDYTDRQRDCCQRLQRRNSKAEIYIRGKYEINTFLIRVCSGGALPRVTILAEWLRYFNDLAVGETAAPACFLRENAEGAGMPPLLSH